MKRQKGFVKRSLAVLMTTVMAFSVIPASASELDENEIVIEAEITESEENVTELAEEAIIESVEAANDNEAAVVNSINVNDKGLYVECTAIGTFPEGTLFDWLVYDVTNNTWSEAKSWSSDKTIKYTPEAKGDYLILVDAKCDGSDASRYVAGFSYRGIYAEVSNISVVKKAGPNYKMTENCNTNDAGIKYKWQVYDVDNNTWNLIKDWSSSNSADFSATHAGAYFFYVEVMTSDGNVQDNLIFYGVSAAEVDSLTVNVTKPYFNGKGIKISGTYSDPFGQVASTKILSFDGCNWTTIADNSLSATWYPRFNGTFAIVMQLLDKDGNIIAQKNQSATIEFATAYSRISNVASTGTLTYKATATVDTNDKGISYCWLVYNNSTGKYWSNSGYGSSKTYSFSVPNEGKFTVELRTKMSDGNISTTKYTFTAQKYPAEEQAMLNKANQYGSNTKYIIIVNCSIHRVLICQGSQGNWTPIQYWQCADGKASTPTKKGVFTIQGKGKSFTSGNAICHWYSQFSGNYLFHSVLYYKSNPTKLMDGRVGVALSHGCVRLKIENAKWIFDNMPRGTKVVVY